ncbi:hypothetical protein GCM10009570_05790 [Dietzia natronolimnaea]
MPERRIATRVQLGGARNGAGTGISGSPMLLDQLQAPHLSGRHARVAGHGSDEIGDQTTGEMDPS